MGDFAGFVARTISGVSATELMNHIRDEHRGRNLFADDDLGIVTGIVKSSSPWACIEGLLFCEKIERFSVLAEKSNVGEGDFCSWREIE